MPIIPSITPQAGGTQPLAAPAPTPFQDQTGEQLARLGRGTAIAGAAGMSVFQKLQEEYDDAKIQEGDALAAEAIEKALYSPEGGYMTLQGRAALGTARKDKFLEVDKELQRIGTTFDSDTQREAFRRMSAQRLRDAQFKADVHQATQTRAYSIGSLEGRGEILKGDAIDHYGAADFEKHKAAFLDVVDRLSDAKGLSEDERTLAHKNALGVLHGEVVQQLVGQGEVTRASELLEKEGAGIDPTMRRKLLSLVKNATVDQQSFLAAQTVSQMEPNLLKQIGILDQLAKSDENPLPIEVRDRAVARLEHEASVRNAETLRVKQEALREAQEWMSAGNELTPAMRTKLEETGQQWKLDAIARSGGTRTTSLYGFRTRVTITDDELLKFNSKADLFDHFFTEMDDEALDIMAAKWERAQVAAGRKRQQDAEAARKDAIKLKFDEEALYHFRRLPEVPDDWDPKGKDRRVEPVQFDNWLRALREEANTRARKDGLDEANSKLIKEAADSLMAPGRVRPEVNGKPQHLAILTGEQFQGGRVPLRPEVAKQVGDAYFDTRLATPDRLAAASAALQQELGAGATFTEEDVYNRAAEMVAEENKAQRKVLTDANERGFNLMRERLVGFLNDPAFQREMRSDTRVINTFDLWGRPTQDRVPDHRSPERKFQELAMDAYGWSLADAYGIDRDEMWDRIGQFWRGQYAYRTDNDIPTEARGKQAAVPSAAGQR